MSTAPDTTSDQRVLAAFDAALAAAGEFAGATAPNPPVGCVLLDIDGNELTRAGHRRAGEPHAEALAIALCDQAGTAHLIHSVIVTLEPCNHVGRTPPCVDAILRTPARQVWIGVADTNPTVPGGGASRLAAAGVRVGYLADLDHPQAMDLSLKAHRLIAPFAKQKRTGLPWVTVKQALNRDGTMVPPHGAKTFTSATSLVLAHRLRKRADAVLTGSGTVLADAPEFTVRRVLDFTGKQRYLSIMDRRGRVPAAYLDAAHARGFEVLLETDIEAALRHVGERGALEVLVEAGPSILQSMRAADLWDEWITIEQGDDGDRVTITLRQNIERKGN